MATLVGTQGNFSDAIKELIELDYDAIEAYRVAINRLENEEFKQQLSSFKNDHERHVTELSALLSSHGITPPDGPSMGKQWLTKGKVVLADLMGDLAIISAMKSNEDDTNTAYERLNAYADKWNDSIVILEKGLNDERRHRAWMESTVNKNS